MLWVNNHFMLMKQLCLKQLESFLKTDHYQNNTDFPFQSFDFAET